MEIRVGAEPIQGYRLIERIGSGGYGEVWKASAPGDLLKAVKFVFGSAGDLRAQQELKSLTRIREVRHPFLLSLERFEFLDEQLLIIMELADRSLLERFQECRHQGLPGIPRGELLVYLRDAADALDYMNETYGLLHLDIKPQNLLLVGGRTKIADFGLVKNLRSGVETSAQSFTPVYAAPEAFDGQVTPYCDQYSLAIVYQEMLTGKRPFPGATALEVAIQHVKSPPQLTALPEADRPIVARSLSKSPERRFRSCREMVDRLLQATPTAAETKALRAGIEASKAESAQSTPSLQAEYPETQAVEPDLLPRAFSSTGPAIEIARIPDDLESPPLLRPTLFVGIGGLGASVLHQLKRRLQDRFTDLAKVGVFQFLLLDTDPANLLGAPTEDHELLFGLDETLHLALYRPEEYRARSKELLRWLDRRWLFAVPRSQLTEGLRPLGRLAFIDHAEEVLNRLRARIKALADPTILDLARTKTGLSLAEEPPRVIVVASSAGGTGGGIVTDLGYAVRQVLAELGHPDDNSMAILLHGTVGTPNEKEMARANTLATLTELHHYSQREHAYAGDAAHGLKSFGREQSPFHECYLSFVGDDCNAEAFVTGASVVAGYLYLDCATAATRFFASYRAQTALAQTAASADPFVRSFGISWIGVLRFQLAKRIAECFCHRLVTHWSSNPGARNDEQLRKWTSHQLDSLGIEPETLARRFEELAASLGFDLQAPLKGKLGTILAEAGEAAGSAGTVTTLSFLAKIDAALGNANEPAGINGPIRTALEQSLAEYAEQLARDRTEAVREWIQQQVEDPKARMLVAEKSAREFLRHVSMAIDRAQKSIEQTQAERETHRRHLQEIEETAGSWRWLWLGRKRSVLADREGELSAYAAARLTEITLHTLLMVLRAVYRAVSDLTQDLLAVRHRLVEFAATFQATPRGKPSPGNGRPPAASNLATLLLSRSEDLDQVADLILESVMPEALFEFDAQFQQKILTSAGGLWTVAHRPSELTVPIRAELIAQTRTAMLDAFHDIDVAHLLLQTHATGDMLETELMRLLQAGRALRLDRAGPPYELFALPCSEAGRTILTRFKLLTNDVPSTAVASEGEVVTCCETGPFSMPAAARILLDQPERYVETARRLQTRTDIDWTPLPLTDNG